MKLQLLAKRSWKTLAVSLMKLAVMNTVIGTFSTSDKQIHE